MSARRRCPGCGRQRTLLPTAADEWLCIDCRDAPPEGRLFGLAALDRDADTSPADVAASVRIFTSRPPPRCRCAHPFGDGYGGCIRCGRRTEA